MCGWGMGGGQRERESTVLRCEMLGVGLLMPNACPDNSFRHRVSQNSRLSLPLFQSCRSTRSATLPIRSSGEEEEREKGTAPMATRMYVCMYVCMVITYSRVWINRVRLPILLVVS